MREYRIVFWLATTSLIACLCLAARAQTQGQTQTPTPTQDVAEAARQAKLKKQQKDGDSSKPPSKPKTYTNDDIPESKASSEKASPQEAQKTNVSPSATGDAAKAILGGKNSATVTVSPVRTSTSHPGGSEVDWSVHNTSDHALQITMTLIVTGPCKYHYETSRGTSLLQSGAQVGDNMFGFAVYEDSCPGTYNIELRAAANGQLLDSATASVTVT